MPFEWDFEENEIGDGNEFDLAEVVACHALRLRGREASGLYRLFARVAFQPRTALPALFALARAALALCAIGATLPGRAVEG